MTRRSAELRKIINRTPLVDTHEHLLEEDLRLIPSDGMHLNDIGILFAMYAESDLLNAGMPTEDMQRAQALATPPDEKWALVRPWWPLIRNTGYGQVITESIRALFDEDRLDDSTWRRINDRITAALKPGVYRRVLRDVANIDHVQVNNLQNPVFRETLYPDILLQDMSFLFLVVPANIGGVAATVGHEIPKTLSEWVAIIDACFEKFAPRAVALKSQIAYARRLDFEWTTVETAEATWNKLVAAGYNLSPEDRKPLEDWAFHYCMRKAVEYNLPVKLHTGYFTATNQMPLHRLNTNGGDACELCLKHPDVRFVFMHTNYPNQDEAISIAKHFTNAYIDMCWSWIINPAATTRFLKEAIKAAPINKLLLFGGDHTQIELVPGHARIARAGLAQALEELIDEGWIEKRDAPFLAERLLNGNARALFDIERCSKANPPRTPEWPAGVVAP